MTRKRISLDGSWEFLPDPNQSFQPHTIKDAGTPRRSIRVPAPWQAQFDDLRGYAGVAWYRREFEIPQIDDIRANPDVTYILHFGAVDYFATVWLNGQLVGEHEGGYLPFELVLDGALRLAGSNEPRFFALSNFITLGRRWMSAEKTCTENPVSGFTMNRCETTVLTTSPNPYG